MTELRLSDIPATLDVKNLLDSPINLLGLVTIKAGATVTVELGKLSPDRRIALFTTIRKAVGANSLAAEVTPDVTKPALRHDRSVSQVARDAELMASGVPAATGTLEEPEPTAPAGDQKPPTAGDQKPPF